MAWPRPHIVGVPMGRLPAVACPSPAILRDRRVPLVDIELAVVTPMFGGGAVPREADPLLPVRGAAVRGHLRFWWRACHAHLFADAEALFARESAIWGAAGKAGTAEGPSAIQVEISITNPGQPRPYRPWYDGKDKHGQPQWKRRKTDYPDYALFPFFGTPRHGFDFEAWRPPPATPVVGVQFQLRLKASVGSGVQRLSFDELQQAAERAVAAWVLFGGLGARTRRGCGSLQCTTDDVRFRPRTERPAASDAEHWTQVAPDLWLRTLIDRQVGVTTLRSARLQAARAIASAPTADVVGAWKTAVELMQAFRQDVGVGRNAGKDSSNRPGMSRWPEPYSVRNIWPGLDEKHNTETHPTVTFFPRADLGLPIVVQQLGPEPFPTLQGVGSGASRMASPIILKALSISDDHHVPFALVLNAPHVWDRGSDDAEFELIRRGKDWYGNGVNEREAIHPDQLHMPSNALVPDPRKLTANARTIRDALVAWAEHADGWGATAVQLP